MNTLPVRKEPTSIRDIEWDTRLRKGVPFSFLATGLGTALILGFGTFLVN
ncbi:MAG: hypothetical protein IIA19_09540 [Thaumarchaeota archaeon]|nr:hypothetical protein [Nitrososphaerota archaeon]